MNRIIKYKSIEPDDILKNGISALDWIDIKFNSKIVFYKSGIYHINYDIIYNIEYSSKYKHITPDFEISSRIIHNNDP